MAKVRQMKKKKDETMKTIKQEEYAKLNRALYNLEDLLSCMGIKEFTLSRDNHTMHIDTNADNIDSTLISSFCNNIEELHDAKFGRQLPQTG
jgi:hypothetical protein